MNASTVLLFGGALFAISRITKKVDAVKAFKYDLSGWPQVSYQNGQVILDIPLVIVNDSREPFDILKVYGQMFIKGSLIGAFTSTNRVVISPYARNNVPVTVSAYLTNAVSSLISAIITKSGEADFTLKGTAQTAVAPIPFVKSFKL